MPASIPITLSEKKWLKNFIEEAFQIKLIDSYSCKLLSELLHKKHHCSINYNTLRRIFDIIPNQNNPSTYSLNLLARAIDFKDYDDFKKHIFKLNTDTLNELILLSFKNNRINHDLMLESIGDISSPNWQEAYQLKNIIDLCIQVKDYPFLKHLFLIKYDKNNEDFLEKFTVCFQSIYIEAFKKNKVLTDFIKNNIPTSEILQRILLQVYISEDHLNDFWGDWLEVSSDDLVDDMGIFRNILLCQKQYNNRETTQAKECLKQAKILAEKSLKKTHPILLGRIAAWETVLGKNAKNNMLYFDQLTSSFDQACFFVFYYRLTSLYSQKPISNSFVENIHVHHLPPTLGAFNKKLISKFYLVRALYFHTQNKLDACKKSLIQVDPNKLDIWETNWYFNHYQELEKLYKSN